MGMRHVSGIICELNPLHNGHKRLLDFSSMDRRSPVVCVLSGNFVQRGDAALFDKWTRCRAALACGADLVIELPISWAMAGAERFALGGVALAAAVGCTKLVFGSECGNTDLLQTIAEYLTGADFTHDLHAAPNEEQTLPFAMRRERAIARRLGETAAEAIRKPNNILAIEYCKAIQTLQAEIKPETCLRQGASHDGPIENDSASASALRKLFLAGKSEQAASFMPPAVHFLKDTPMASISRLEAAILYRLRTACPEDFAQTPDVREGLENKILAAARQATTLEELYDLAKSKRYSHARIRRIVLSYFLGIQNQPALPPYLRVLGMTPTGAALLKQARLPVVTRACELRDRNRICQSVFKLESAADDIYALAVSPALPAGSNEQHGLIRFGF